jgi:hypothetical protein
VDFHQKNLRQILAPDGEGEVSQQAEQRHKHDDEYPRAALPVAEFLGIDADDRAGDEGDPDQKEAEENLPVEFGGFETEPIEDFAHEDLVCFGCRGPVWREVRSFGAVFGAWQNKNVSAVICPQPGADGRSQGRLKDFIDFSTLNFVFFGKRTTDQNTLQKRVC